MDGFQQVVERVGQHIRNLRRAERLTQKELAEKAGVFDVGELERGRKVKDGPVNPRVETLHRIASALEVDIEELFGLSSSKPVIANPHLLELVALLEKQDEKTIQNALEFVKAMLQFKDQS